MLLSYILSGRKRKEKGKKRALAGDTKLSKEFVYSKTPCYEGMAQT